MSDVIWAAIIAGGVGLLGGIGANVVTYLIARRTGAVELRKVEAENQRLIAQLQEAERQNRQGTYHRVLAALDRFDMFATGWLPDDETLENTLNEFNALVGGVHLFGDQGVRDAMRSVSGLLADVGVIAGGLHSQGDASKAASFAEAYMTRRDGMLAALDLLVEAMRADVTAGVLPPASVERST